MQKFLIHAGQICNLCCFCFFFFFPISTKKENCVIRNKTSVEWRFRCIAYCLKAFLKPCIALLRSAAVDLVCWWQTRSCDAPSRTSCGQTFTVASWCATGLEKWGERYCRAELGAKERKFWESLWLLGTDTVHSPIMAIVKKINSK